RQSHTPGAFPRFALGRSQFVPAAFEEAESWRDENTPENTLGMLFCEPTRREAAHTRPHQPNSSVSASGQPVAHGREVFDEPTRAQLVHFTRRLAVAAEVECREGPPAAGAFLLQRFRFLAAAMAAEPMNPHDRESWVVRAGI